MNIPHSILFLIEGMLIGLAVVVAVRAFKIVFRRLNDPQGFLFRLPKGIIVYGVSTRERETGQEPVPKPGIRVLARDRRLSGSDQHLQEAA